MITFKQLYESLEIDDYQTEPKTISKNDLIRVDKGIYLNTINHTDLYINFDTFQWFYDKLKFKPEINNIYNTQYHDMQNQAPATMPIDYYVVDLHKLYNWLDEDTYYLDRTGHKIRLKRYQTVSKPILNRLNRFLKHYYPEFSENNIEKYIRFK